MNGELLKRLFRAVAGGNSEAIQSMLCVVLQEERKKKHTKLAEELESILRINHFVTAKPSSVPDSSKISEAASDSAISKLPNALALSQLSNKRRFNHPFIIITPRESLRHQMILCDGIEARFRRIEREYAERDRLAHYGLRYRQKILLYGSPGCGKTMGAERLAWNTGLTLVKVRFDAMVSSYLGETATNLREVFETAAQIPCLLFIDECDVLAKSRKDSQEIGEIKRVVNTFLQLLDEYEMTNGLLVAATNLTKFLDEAVWRRFDDVIEVPKPTSSEIVAILKQTLSSVKLGLVDWEIMGEKMMNFSASQVVKIAQNAAKAALLDREKLVAQKHLDSSLEEILCS